MSEDSNEKAEQDSAPGGGDGGEAAPAPSEKEGRAAKSDAGGAPGKAATVPATATASQETAKGGGDRAWTIGVAAVCVVAALFLGRSWGAHEAMTAQGAAAAAADPAAEEVNAGLAATDPADAVAHFRKALEQNPTHYGATFQLARALDRAGKKDEAKAQWERVLRMAQAANDQSLVETARARLGAPAPPNAAAPPADPMLAGLDALYTKRDPATAIARFRDVLAQNPDHYGATFQLATALDQAGDLKSSRPIWEKMVAMAEATGDTKTADLARARLVDIDKQLGPAAPPDADADAMRAAVDALYVKKDPDAAIPLFRAILKRNPTHYGATFQLATALDQAKKPTEARPLWEKALKMAEGMSDEKTAALARARLAQKP